MAAQQWHNDTPLDPARLTLDDILYAACPATEPDAHGYVDYVIETHCVTFTITAKLHEGTFHISNVKYV